jgi:hypothetical protein
MTNLVEKLQDQAYTVFAIEIDEKRAEKIQSRKDMQEVSKIRDSEKAMITKTVKPLYDFYSEYIQSRIGMLQNSAIPTFTEIMTKNYMSPSQQNITDIVEELNNGRKKLSSLMSSIHSLNWNHLPSSDMPMYNKEDSYTSRKILEFSSAIKRIKENYADDLERAIRHKKRQAVKAIQNGNVTEAIDKLNDIGKKDLANKFKHFKHLAPSQFDVPAMSEEIMAD